MKMHAMWGLLALLVASTSSAMVVQVGIEDFRFVSNDITIHVGDTVHWVNQAGDHNVVADNGSFSSGNIRSGGWTFDRTFTTAGEVRYYCANHSGPGLNINTNMNGRIVVLDAAPPPPPPFAINQGISGSWYNPLTGGQGFLFDIRPNDNFLFAAWFTYEKGAAVAGQTQAKVGATDQRWLTIQGNYMGDHATSPIFLTTGGLFDAAQHPTTTAVGTATVTFTSCTAGTIAYTLTDGNLTGTIPIQRLIPGTETICQTLAAAPAGAAQSADAAAQ